MPEHPMFDQLTLSDELRAQLVESVKDERVFNAVRGQCHTRYFNEVGCWVVTDRRVIFAYKKGGRLRKERLDINTVHLKDIDNFGLQGSGPAFVLGGRNEHGVAMLMRGRVISDDEAESAQRLLDVIQEVITSTG